MRHCTGIYSNFVATLCLNDGQTPKAEKLLKTKGRKRYFSSIKAENILKIKAVTKNCRTSIFGGQKVLLDRSLWMKIGGTLEWAVRRHAGSGQPLRGTFLLLCRLS
jgi:hypothetical protein